MIACIFFDNPPILEAKNNDGDNLSGTGNTTMLTLSVYSADGEFILTCQMEDMASFLHVIHTEFEPRWAADPNKAAISGKMLVIDSVRGPDSMTPVLSQRQREIVELLSRSFSPKQIACALGISESTVRMHINTLKKRFNVTSCYHLMTVVTALGLCDPFVDEPHEKSITLLYDDDRGLRKPRRLQPPREPEDPRASRKEGDGTP